MSIPRVLLSGRLTQKLTNSGLHTFTCGDSPDVLLIFDPRTSSALAQFEGRSIEILVRDIEPPSVWTTEEQLP
jgi:hypothetical protein